MRRLGYLPDTRDTAAVVTAGKPELSETELQIEFEVARRVADHQKATWLATAEYRTARRAELDAARALHKAEPTSETRAYVEIIERVYRETQTYEDLLKKQHAASRARLTQANAVRQARTGVSGSTSQGSQPKPPGS